LIPLDCHASAWAELARAAVVARNPHDHGGVMDRLGVRAEQAMLGAVLSDPAGQPQVLDWVEPGDMCRPWHGQVLGAMQRLRGRAFLLGRWRSTQSSRMILACP
jgi:hypothetical protein